MAILLLLQHREQVTAAEVARELEISERTARRDLPPWAWPACRCTPCRAEAAAGASWAAPAPTCPG
ncbi:helix-turn-helix domain-containing protein [Dactylosporangium sp. NPDC000555]|uniref:helix-turn-helix domain-containing protein n=1 Tax=Dactylosporangium sp. NPDC000555 TaxID=3154260 RepID=UPI003316F9D0